MKQYIFVPIVVVSKNYFLKIQYSILTFKFNIYD